MNVLTTPQRVVITAAAFSLPLAAALVWLVEPSGAALQDPAILFVGVAYLLALYTTIAHHLQIKDGLAIVQMESVTQQNAALVEQAAASTLAFEEQAASLVAAVSKFKLAGSPAPSARVPLALSVLVRHRGQTGS